MSILQELNTLMEKKVADEKYFVTVGKGKSFDLYTERSFSSFDAAQTFITKEMKSLADGRAVSKQADKDFEALEQAEIMPGKELKAKYPKLFEAKEESTYKSFASWKAAAKKANVEVWIEGDKDIAQAMVGKKPFTRGLTKSIGEWDGSEGVIYKDRLKEDAELQALGKSLATSKPATSDEQDETPKEVKIKVGDIVKALAGPHKGEDHDVVKIHADGRLDIKPRDIEGSAVKYRNGGVIAKPEQVQLVESVARTSKPLLGDITSSLSEERNETDGTKKFKVNIGDKIEFSKSSKKPEGGSGEVLGFRQGGFAVSNGVGYVKALDLTSVKPIREGKNDNMMPLSYRPGRGHTIEAYGRKGMKNTMWRKCFKDSAALEKWCDDNDATVEGSRTLDKEEMR